LTTSEVALKAFKGGFASPVHPSSVVDRAVQHYRDKIHLCEGEIAKLEATLSAEEENRQVAAANGWVRGREMDVDKSSSLRKHHGLDRRLRMLPGVDCLSNFSKTGRLVSFLLVVHAGRNSPDLISKFSLQTFSILTKSVFLFHRSLEVATLCRSTTA